MQQDFKEIMREFGIELKDMIFTAFDKYFLMSVLIGFTVFLSYIIYRLFNQSQ